MADLDAIVERGEHISKKCLSASGTVLCILSGKISAISQDSPRSQALPMQSCSACLLHIRIHHVHAVLLQTDWIATPCI